MGALDRLRDDVEVLARVQRHGDARPPWSTSALAHWPAQLTTTSHSTGPRSVSTAVMRCRRVEREPGDPCLLHHLGAAHPGALGQRLGEVGRVDLAVARQPQRTEQVLDLHHRPQLLRALGRDQLAVHVVRRRVGRGPLQLDHPVLGPGHDHATDVAVAGSQPGLGLERGVELGGVLHQPGPALRGPQRPDQPGRVPRRTAGEVALLEQQHVGLPQLGQVEATDAPMTPPPTTTISGARGEVSHGRHPRSSLARSGPRKVASAFSKRSIPHPWKS